MYNQSEPDLSTLPSSKSSAVFVKTTEPISALEKHASDLIVADNDKDEYPDKGTNSADLEPETHQNGSNVFAWLKQLALRYRQFWAGAVWCTLSMYFIAGLAARQKTQPSDVLPFIALYMFITGRIAFYYIHIDKMFQKSRRLGDVWNGLVCKVNSKLTARMQYLLSSLFLLALALIVSLGLPVRRGETRLARMQSFLGILAITALLVGTSRNRRHINWRTVIGGYLMQFCVGCIVMKTSWGSSLFTWLANIASAFLAFSRYGAALLLGDSAVNSGAIAVTMFPVIIFFASFVQMMYYLGGIQWLLKRIGWFFHWTLDTSGAEAIVASASPFVGQSENTLLVKDYLEHMTDSELHACMTAGFATISGSVFQAYVVLGVDAKNLITACIMSIPCSLALSKIRYPETGTPRTRGQIAVSERKRESNILHALGNGAATGVHLCLLILATIVGMVSLIYAINFMLTWLGQFIGIQDLTLELVLGYLLCPLTWLLGVPASDVLPVSKLLGLKLVANEFIAYSRLTGGGGATAGLGEPVQNQLTARGLMIAQFSLAGFANTGSVAQVIATIGALAPSRKEDVSRLALSACLTGAIATMLTAAIVSMIV
ncbi:hypothetical protein GGH99_003614 [Coemansia sp. RSA 1285]|nr:hypothetical protein EV177_003633 [Coemansia sp. RSA 1804]KAJ2685963.1 hypothetical protein GGH99_003614 [Coemansia sp. RSA 1285]